MRIGSAASGFSQAGGMLASRSVKTSIDHSQIKR
jgi:hypothetical protein